MNANIVIDISPQIPFLAKVWFLSYRPKWCQPMKLQDSSKHNISKKKKVNNEVYFWHADKHQSFLQVGSIVLGVRNQACPNYPKNVYLWNISRKMWPMKLIFCLQINTEVFYKLIVSLWVCVARHAQST